MIENYYLKEEARQLSLNEKLSKLIRNEFDSSIYI